MTVCEYWHTNVFRLAPLWNISSAFRKMYTEFICISLFVARRSKWHSRHADTVTPKWKTLITSDLKGVKSTHSNFHENPLKSLGGVCYCSPGPTFTYMYEIRWTCVSYQIYKKVSCDHRLNSIRSWPFWNKQPFFAICRLCTLRGTSKSICPAHLRNQWNM